MTFDSPYLLFSDLRCLFDSSLLRSPFLDDLSLSLDLERSRFSLDFEWSLSLSLCRGLVSSLDSRSCKPPGPEACSPLLISPCFHAGRVASAPFKTHAYDREVATHRRVLVHCSALLWREDHLDTNAERCLSMGAILTCTSPGHLVVFNRISTQ